MTTTNIKRIKQDFEQGKTMVCPECKKVISISECTWAERMLTIQRTLRDINKGLSKQLLDVRMNKNGIIQRMYKLVGQLLELMNDEQLIKAKKINQEMRDEIKKWEKQKK